jgi:hypothetical protein
MTRPVYGPYGGSLRARERPLEGSGGASRVKQEAGGETENA